MPGGMPGAFGAAGGKLHQLLLQCRWHFVARRKWLGRGIRRTNRGGGSSLGREHARVGEWHPTAHQV